MEEKKCSVCGEVKPLEEFYKQNKFSKKRGHWIYYNPECKSCTSNRSQQWRYDNPEKYKENNDKYESKDKRVKGKRRNVKKWRDEGKYKIYCQENKDKIKKYQRYRNQHKKHEIDENEWLECKEFFDNSCAYCGLNIKDHLVTYKGELIQSDLHKEHVNHNGANDITNCVPACKSCNVSKWQFDLEDWYPKNDFYDESKLNRIYEWLDGFR